MVAPSALRDVMSTEVVALTPEMTVRRAAGVLSEARISGAPVVAGGRVVGVVSAGDLLQFAAHPRLSGSQPEVGARLRSEPSTSPSEFFFRYWGESEGDLCDRLVARGDGRGSAGERLLDGFRVADVMSRDLHALAPDTSLSDAADYMLRHEIHRLLVVDDERLEGVVTTADMVRAMGAGGSRRRF